MTPDQYGTLVRALEQRARRYPALYRTQVAAVAALGYAYVVGLLLLLIGLVVGLGYLALYAGGGAILVKLLLPIAALAYVLLRALWIHVPDLEGIPLPPDRFPALAATIERLRVRMDAPSFRRVLLDGDFNAAVAQRPRFGLIGPSVSDLVLGLPLMQALSPQEFEAVLSHELGHVSRQHGRFGHWIYRIRTTWSRLAGVVENSGGIGAALVLGRFLSWYAPFFSASSFVLARLDEYEADSAAVRVAGRSVVAAALVRIEILGRFHSERHWGRIAQEITGGGQIPQPHAGFVQRLTTQLEPAEAERWLAEALRRQTDYSHTHPCLSDRLRAIGIGGAPVPPPFPSESAATALLGPAVDALARDLDQRWQAQVEPQLAQVLAEREAAARRLAELEAGAAPGAAAVWERVELLDRLGRTAEARERAEALLQAEPNHVRALFFVGQARLAADEADGVVLLERAAALHPQAAPAAVALIFDYHWRHGRREEAEAARARLAGARDRLAAAERERASLAERPVLVPHGLPADQVQRIRAAMASVPGLRAVYLTRRVVVELPELPCYLVGVVAAGSWWRFRKGTEGARLRDAVMAATEWPESTYFVVGEGHHARLVRRMRKVPGAGLTGAEQRPAQVSAMDPARLEALRTRLAGRRVRRRRVAVALLTFLVGVMILAGWAYQQREEAIATTPIRQLTVAQAADRVRAARGHPLILVLYDPEPDDALLVADLRRWATPLGPARIELLALAVGKRRDAQAFFRYAGERGLPLLAPLWLEPWRSGTLDSTMGELGVRVGDRWHVPLVAVVDSRGGIIAQWQGETASAPVIAAAEAALVP